MSITLPHSSKNDILGDVHSNLFKRHFNPYKKVGNDHDEEHDWMLLYHNEF